MDALPLRPLMTRTGCQVPAERAEDIREDINASTTSRLSSTTSIREIKVFLAEERVPRFHVGAALVLSALLLL